MIGQTISHYRVLEEIGGGGMGVVYKAEDTRLNRHVALKFLPPDLTRDPEARKRFIREAQTASSLEHNNICNIHEIEETADGQTFIVMACYDGETLKEMIKKDPLSIKDTLSISSQIANGLKKAHENGIIHRDIKSANIIITEDGTAKIVDFGLAKLRQQSGITKTGVTLGTSSYMSPEQARGKEIDHRSDIFSLGIVLYEMIAGALPFQGDYDQAILYSIIHEEPESLSKIRSDIPIELERIIQLCLAKSPDKRYQHLSDLLQDLGNIQVDTDSHRSSGPMLKLLNKPVRIWGISVGLLLVVLVVLNSVLKFGLFRNNRRDPGLLENALAVMVCENRQNMDDPQLTGRMVTDALITDLMGIRAVSVVSLQRLYDLQSGMGVESRMNLNKSLQIKVARRAGVSVFISPSLGRLGSRYLLTAQCIDVRTGKILESLEIEGTEETVHTMVDEMSIQIRERLDIPVDLAEAQDRPIGEVTTYSPEAYSLYLKAEEMISNYKMEEAAKALEEAVTIDPRFATAYSRLSVVYNHFQQYEQERLALQNAFENITHLKEREKFYIRYRMARNKQEYEEAKEILFEWIERFPEDKLAYYELGHLYELVFRMFDEAIFHYNKAIDLDNAYRQAFNELGYTYAKKSMSKEALAAFGRYVSLAPEEPNPYDSLGEIYMNLLGDYTRAEAAFLKVIDIDPEFAPQKLAELYMLTGRYQKADSIYQKILVIEHPSTVTAIKYFFLARLEFERQNFDSVLCNLMKAKSYNPLYGKLYWLSGLAHLKLGQMEKAKEELEHIERIDSTSVIYFHLLGSYQLAMGNPEEAISNLRMSTQIIQGISFSWIEHNEYFRQSLIETFLALGDIDNAIKECQILLSNNPNWAMAHYRLGQLYDKKGWVKKARAAYIDFLDKWKDADSDILSIKTARQRLQSLSAQ